MTIYFATGNAHKLQEAQAVFGPEIEVEQVLVEKNEDTGDIFTIAKREAKRIANETNKPVMVDDTGIFFLALDNFPGNRPKRAFEEFGYDGLMQRLIGKSREAKFVCCVAYCKPGEEPQLFVGELEGEITEQVFDPDKDVMPYERIFKLSDGRVISQLTREQKNAISHRAKAFLEVKQFLLSE